MMFPSTFITAVAIGVTAALMIANWFIWGLNDPRSLRQSSTVTPIGGREILESALRRMMALNEAVIPQRKEAAAKVTRSGEGDDGFKHVA